MLYPPLRMIEIDPWSERRHQNILKRHEPCAFQGVGTSRGLVSVGVGRDGHEILSSHPLLRTLTTPRRWQVDKERTNFGLNGFYGACIYSYFHTS